MTLSDIPDGLHPMQYAAKLCEDTLGVPKKGNLEVIAEAIEAISKSKLFRGRNDAMKLAYFWLDRRVSVAREQGEKINNLWFIQGGYWDVERPQS